MVVDRWVWVLLMVVGTVGCCFCLFIYFLSYGVNDWSLRSEGGVPTATMIGV